MSTPPLTTSPSSECLTVHFPSSGPSTPTAPDWSRNPVRFLNCAFDSEEDEINDDEEMQPIGESRMKGIRSSSIHLRAAITPPRNTAQDSKPSPSHFIVKGTVTPSRAAPLFARFSKHQRAAKRTRRDDWSDSDMDEDIDENVIPVQPIACWSSGKSSPSTPSRRQLSTAAHRYPLQPLSSSCLQEASTGVSEATLPLPIATRSHYVAASQRASQLPLMPSPIPVMQRHRMATSNVASYLHAMRSNSLGHLSYASSTRGNLAISCGRGVLGAARLLGAGGGLGFAHNVSHLPFHRTFRNTSRPSIDLFTLPSEQADRQFSHPLCAEYANSSRCLSGDKAQWLAVGSNEGRIYLLNTREDSAFNSDGSSPSWTGHDGSIFEVKWRHDDEMIATGGSDYNINVWDTSTGAEVRSFSGHRGTPRSITWDPNGNGNLLASGGRDGAIHVYDIRVPDTRDKTHSRTADGEPVASLWGAHTYEPPRPLRGPGSRGGRRGGTNGRALYPKGVTSLTYVPGRGASVLCSAGCGDGIIKLWDLRAMKECEQVSEGRIKSHGSTARTFTSSGVKPLEEGPDVSTQFRRNKSSHGISSVVASTTKIFAACTDGCIYTLSAADLRNPYSTGIGLPAVPLFDPAQRGNTLYARLALHDDERTLALGCNSGTITLWDTHTAGLAAAELASLGVDMSSLRAMDGDSDYGQGREDLIELAKPAILRGGHRGNYEINGVSWAHGVNGPTLASISDDFSIRTWKASSTNDEDSE